MKKIIIGVNENGLPIGENHHNVKLPDADVELIRDIYEEGMASYDTLAKVFGVSKSHIRDIVTFRRRGVTPAEYRPVDATQRRPVPVSILKKLGIDASAPVREDD